MGRAAAVHGVHYRGTRRFALVVFVLMIAPTLWLGLRTYGSFYLLRSAYEAGAPTTSSIRAWMTLDYVAAAFRVPKARLITQLGLPPATNGDSSLKSLASTAGLSPSQYVQLVQRAIANISPNVRSNQHAGDAPSWFETISDQTLTALLVYGYPVLGLTLLFGAVGLPLPDGIAAAFAGTLVAQGRLNWAGAAATILFASLLGDIVGYFLGRWLGREILVSRGRWFGYTPERHARAQVLFERWGGLTIFMTRTFMSYLSSVSNLLAGMSCYDLPKFLAIVLAGRLLWTAAYLGLGYMIGGDWEAATAFLTNLSGLTIALTALGVSGAVAWWPNPVERA